MQKIPRISGRIPGRIWRNNWPQPINQRSLCGWYQHQLSEQQRAKSYLYLRRFMERVQSSSCLPLRRWLRTSQLRVITVNQGTLLPPSQTAFFIVTTRWIGKFMLQSFKPCTTFPAPVTGNLEVHICTDQNLADEDVPIEYLELYLYNPVYPAYLAR